ncbi:unnamed protein product [Moneuplotes crassus]|uniref:Uncharacterized protein n=1 Tax=Euplotes crassus TaxID=5936 RepID=A0AAD1X9N0_EUPCR|nr:unnamed protein product [Moneuplotes crassus]
MTFGWDLFIAFLINFFMILSRISIPFLIIFIVKYMSAPSGEDGGLAYGVYLLSGYVIITGSTFILNQQAQFIQTLVGEKAFGSLTCLIYEKILKITPSSNKEFKQGEIINFVQVDMGEVINLSSTFPPVAMLPIQLVFGLVFIFYYFGWNFLPSLCIAIFIFMLNFQVAFWIAKLQSQTLEKTDQRMNVTTEAVNNIKVIKLNSWEKYFYEKVKSLRILEQSKVKLIFITRGLQYIPLWAISPIFMVLTFTIFYATGNTMTLAYAFAARHIFYSLEQPMRRIPAFIGSYMEFLVSMKRIQKFLQCPEINPNIIKIQDEGLEQSGIDILMNNCNFTWGVSKENLQVEDKNIKDENKDLIEMIEVKNKQKYKPLEEGKYDEESKKEYSKQDIYQPYISGLTLGNSIELKNINLQISKGEFVCIIGQVGSGKSSLLSAILGDMLYLSDETIQAYQHRVLDDGLRRELHEAQQREASVIRLGGSVSYVQQVPWIQNKTIRDNILFGKRMDEQRYNQVIEMCELGPDLGLFPGGDLTEIGEKGINLSGGQKARVSLARAIYADNDIMLMDDPVSALDANVKCKLKAVFTAELSHKTRVLVTHAVDFIDCVDRIIVMETGRIKYNGTYEELQHHEEIKHIIEVLAHQAHDEDSSCENPSEDSPEIEIQQQKPYLEKNIARITEEENNEVINVGWETYRNLFCNNQLWIFYLMTFPFFTLYAYVHARSSIVFGYWVVENLNDTYFGTNYILTWLFPIAGQLLISGIFTFLKLVFLRSGRILYQQMFRKTLNASINLYFDRTPSGVILNRYSKDINYVDHEISEKLIWMTESYVAFGYNVSVAITAMPWTAAVLPFVGLLCFIIIKLYIKTYRELNRLSSVAYSPILSVVSESLQGNTTIRNFQKQKLFQDQVFEIVNQKVNCNFWKDATQKWFNIRVELSGRLIIISCMILMLYFKSQINPVLVGAFLVHMINMNMELIWGSQCITELEGKLVSYQRCVKLLNIPQEVTQEKQENISSEWPKSGRIGFNNFSLKYRPTTPTVLKNLSLSINNGEKIGVVGRTGAGKSTLCLALCRIVEAYQGSIIIDEQDISTVDLEQLRNKITIIPQDPTLFNGSLRFNLNPEGIHPDSTLLDLASQASLQKLVDRDDKGLDQNIEEGGANLSSGEKQLLCICRAILRKNRVVLMDEATANIDIKTEQTIQELINTQFRDSTVITIAHRLNTIMSSDRILVLSHGELVEYDSPGNLLKDPESMFKSYVDSFKNK